MKTQEITNNEDMIDSRDVMARIEELEQERDTFFEDHNIPASEIGNSENKDYMEWEESDEAEELKSLSSFLEQFCGNGGDEQWRGDWYPVTLIRDSYFTDYTEELLIDCGYISKDFPSWIEIDWASTAENVKVDYTSADFDGVEYWAR